MNAPLQTAKALLSPPGDTIRETLDVIEMSQAELAERIRCFANKFCVPASIILGRLQHLGVVRYSWGNELKQQIQLFDDN